MRKKLLIVLVFLFLSSLLFGGYMVIKAKNSQNGDFDYKIKKGEEFIINLDENVTTGHSWNYKIDNEKIVKLLEDEHIEPSTKLIGASGSHKFVFLGEKKGEATITFKYFRVWKDEESSVDMKEFKIKVY